MVPTVSLPKGQLPTVTPILYLLPFCVQGLLDVRTCCSRMLFQEGRGLLLVEQVSLSTPETQQGALCWLRRTPGSSHTLSLRSGSLPGPSSDRTEAVRGKER